MEASWEELRALEAEVAALRRARSRAPWGDALGAGHQLRSEEGNSSENLKNHIGQLESELAFLSKLTGINITKCSKYTEEITSAEMKEAGIKKVLQKHRLSGHCHMIRFELEFQILEIQNKENSSSVITDLNIIEPTNYPELSEFVSSVEERRDLVLFFQTLHFFVECFEHRMRTFKHFKEKYPGTVHLYEGTSGSSMGIRSTKQPGFECLIVWMIQIDERGKVWPALDLLPQVPEQALELDKNRIIETAPLSFRSLLGVLGIQGTLESLITVFGLPAHA
ncbi:centromere protein P [Sorex fumeus]|uniref:centromere protein P n=1 Tax=Sorex fumeus TaxID=62283 RepID=UPI0024ACAB62|nr:centromere protein P [Sorex fumeus]